MRSERSVERIGILFVLLYSIPLIVAVLSFSYFAAVGPTNRASHSALYAAILAVGFYVLVVKVEIHEVIRRRVKGIEERIRSTFEDLFYRHPVKTLVVYYHSDEILRASATMHKAGEELNVLAEHGGLRLDAMFRWLNPLYVGIGMLLFVILWQANEHLIQSIALVYALAVSITVALFYLSTGLLLVLPPFLSVFANQTYKFKLFGFSLSSFSPLENLLVSARTRMLPILQNEYLSVCIEPKKVSNPQGLHHSFVAVDPQISEVIVNWVQSSLVGAPSGQTAHR